MKENKINRFEALRLGLLRCLQLSQQAQTYTKQLEIHWLSERIGAKMTYILETT